MEKLGFSPVKLWGGLENYFGIGDIGIFLFDCKNAFKGGKKRNIMTISILTPYFWKVEADTLKDIMLEFFSNFQKLSGKLTKVTLIKNQESESASYLIQGDENSKEYIKPNADEEAPIIYKAKPSDNKKYTLLCYMEAILRGEK